MLSASTTLPSCLIIIFILYTSKNNAKLQNVMYTILRVRISPSFYSFFDLFSSRRVILFFFVLH